MFVLGEGSAKKEGPSSKHRTLTVTFAVLTIVVFVITTNLKLASLAPELAKLHHFSTRFEEEIIKLGSIPVKVTTHGALDKEPCILVAATSPNYTWSRGWAERRRREGVPFVLLEMMKIRKGELAGYWSKVPGIIAAYHILRNAKIIVYSDVDTEVAWPYVCKLGRESSKAMTLSYKIWPPSDPKIHMRTNWLTLKSNHPEAKHLLYTWYYKGWNIPAQDQTILNLLYHNKSWIRDSIDLFRVGSNHFKKTELRQCGSWMKPAEVRAQCMGIKL